MNTDPVLQIHDRLLALASLRTSLVNEQNRKENSGSYLRALDKAFVSHCKKWHPTMREMADTPAETLDGVIAKLRILAASVLSDRRTSYDEDILLMAIADLERLYEGNTQA